MIYFFAMSKNGVLRNGEFIEKENMDWDWHEKFGSNN